MTGYPNFIVEDLQNLISKHSLSICHQNICGLSRKIDSLCVLLDSHKGIHMLGLGQMHLYDNVYDNEIEISGYKLFKKDRFGNNYGGIVVYLRDTINVIRCIDLEIETIWVEITIPCTRAYWWVTFIDLRTVCNIWTLISFLNFMMCCPLQPWKEGKL